MAVAKPVDLKIEITSMLGQMVHTYNKGRISEGVHSVDLNLEGLRPGVYQYTFVAGGERVSGKLIKK